MNEDAVRRVTETVGPDVVDVLATMPGADLTTLMLEVARRRAGRVRPADMVHRYRSDRFVGPGTVDARRLLEAERSVAAQLPDGTAMMVLSPVAPFGTHAVAGVAQSRIVSTVRGTEVAADPTNVLALEAAQRRRDLMRDDARTAEHVRLAACQRVTRGQTFGGSRSFAHFTLFGLVTAGRDTGNPAFERSAAAEHVGFVARAILATTEPPSS